MIRVPVPSSPCTEKQSKSKSSAADSRREVQDTFQDNFAQTFMFKVSTCFQTTSRGEGNMSNE